jgi:DNA-binding PadR family transcriptional regulator
MTLSEPRRRTPDEHLPLTPVAFEILLALAGGALHGYAILQDIEARTGGRLALHAGTLYRALARLAEAALLEELEGPSGPGEDGRRRYYRLTRLGRRVAAAEAARLERQVGVARARALLGGGAS